MQDKKSCLSCTSCLKVFVIGELLPFSYNYNPEGGQGLTSTVRVADAALFAVSLAVIVMTLSSPSPA